MAKHEFNGSYSGECLDKIAFPVGGIGAGMFCMEGTGTISHMSVRHEPNIFMEPVMFGALHVKAIENGSRILEGPVPMWKAFGPAGTGNGGNGKTYGLPRYREAVFDSRFPFCTVSLSDKDMPVKATLTAFSPFTPGNADDSSLPVGCVEYTFTNTSGAKQEAVFSYHARNFMAAGMKPEQQRVTAADKGFVLMADAVKDKKHLEGYFGIVCDDPNAKVDCRLFRGGWFDCNTIIWKSIANGDVIENPPFPKTDTKPSPGGSVYVPFTLDKGETRTIRMRMAWYVPMSAVRTGSDPEEECGEDCDCGAKPKDTYTPWYAARFKDVDYVLAYWASEYDRLRQESETFRDCLFDTTIPDEVMEAVSANLAILKSPTVLREKGGRFWAWEGCGDSNGCCAGTCTHVWNYAQALPHLFPELARSLRDTEFNESQNREGNQRFRSSLPLRQSVNDFHAAADGQLGGISKVYRDWRISGDTEWLKNIWPKVKDSLEYCIATWDPAEEGYFAEPHHNTYDIEFWGPDGMCTSFYCGALIAGREMAKALSDRKAEARFDDLYRKARTFLEGELFDGEYFFQKIEWKNLRAGDPVKLQSWNNDYSSEASALLQAEGPKYQYGTGCLTDGILGAWISEMAGLPDIISREKVVSHLKAIYKYNLKTDLSLHANPQRPTYAMGRDGGLLACSWPKGGKLTLPFPYSDEVWTGMEYHVASHLIMKGLVDEGLEIVRIARERYDGRVRNPFNEYECGHWYARALSSYGLLFSFSGARYDAVEKILYLNPIVKGDFQSFLSTATGYGTVGIKDGKPFCEVKSGTIEVAKIEVGQ